jgi:hypothetical protein
MSYIAAFGMLMMFFIACIVLLRLVAIDNISTSSTLRHVPTVPESVLTPVLMNSATHVAKYVATHVETHVAKPVATDVAKPVATDVAKPVAKHVSLLSWFMPKVSKSSFKKNNTTVQQYFIPQNLRGSTVVCKENSENLKKYNISLPAENDEDIIIAQVKNLLPQIYDKGYTRVRVCHSNCETTSNEFKFNLISIFPKLELSIQNFFNKFESIGNPYEVQFCKP